MKKFFAVLCAAAVWSCCANPTRVTPINPAEAIFAPFWDGEMRELSRCWDAPKGTFEQDWPCVNVSWGRADIQAGEPVAKLVRKFPVNCSGYDKLIACFRLPPESKMKITLDTDKGELSGEWIGKSNFRDEYAMDLNGASLVKQMTVEWFDTGKNKVRKGVIYWIGLQNSAELEKMLGRTAKFAEQPLDLFLRPESEKPSFFGHIGLLAPNSSLVAVQKKCREYVKKHGNPPFSRDLTMKPEKQLRQSVPWANPAMFGRVRDDDHRVQDPISYLQYALMTRNPAALRIAAKAALTLALTPNWDSTFMSDFADSGWDQRVFAQAQVAESIALTLDYAHDILTPAGKQLLLKKLATEGLGNINYNIWRYTYLFGNNQLTVFSRGRIAALLALEKAGGWNGPRVKPYTELAMRELFDSIARLVYPDGSFLEGPGYFFYTIGSLRPILEMYASARNIPLDRVVPPELSKLGSFADVFISTDRRGGVIPYSSCQGEGRGASLSTVLLLARLSPDSQWTTLYRNGLVADRLYCDVGFEAAREAFQAQAPEPKPLAALPVMGVVASTRKFGNQTVKLLLSGTKANCTSHRHNDRGAFVLEFAGDTFAADPGGQNYGDADADLVKRADYHNMLVPEMPRENEKVTVSAVDIHPKAEGNEKSFRGEIHPAPASAGDFKEWSRVIDSPSPDRFIFRDRYTTGKEHKGARFIWITELPWKRLAPGTVRIDGKEGYLLLKFDPSKLKFSADELTVRRKYQFHRLQFLCPEVSGKIEVAAELHQK